MSGRGRNHRLWIQFVHNHVTVEGERIWSLGVKITTSLLLQVCRNAVTMQETPSPGNVVCTLSGKTLLDQIDHNFVYRYCQARQVVRRINSGSKSRSAAFNVLAEKKVVFHLGSVARSIFSPLMITSTLYLQLANLSTENSLRRQLFRSQVYSGSKRIVTQHQNSFKVPVS